MKKSISNPITLEEGKKEKYMDRIAII